MISLLCPSRSRPQKSFDTIKRWIQRAGTTDLDVILSIDCDDDKLPEYYRLYEKLDFDFLWLDEPNKNAVEAINGAAREARGNIMIVVSDDLDCPIGWAKKILKYTEGKQDFVIKVQDGIQPVIITQPILDRAYYQRDGFIYHPKFEHAWSDRFFTELAHKRKRVITKNILFKHNHYSVMKDKRRDEQYAKTDATFESGRKIYHELKKEYGL